MPEKRFTRNRRAERPATQDDNDLACDYTDWDFAALNADVTAARAVRQAEGVGAMLAKANGIPNDRWRAAGGIDRPAGK